MGSLQKVDDQIHDYNPHSLTIGHNDKLHLNPKLANNDLIIINGFLILEEKKNQNKIISTKINPEQSVEQLRFQSEGDINNRVFAVNTYEKELKNLEKNEFFEEILIQDSKVNIYALKKLVQIIASQVKVITINNCLFFKSDSSALLNKNVQSNNKMLKELNFQFLLKLYELPQIEAINIQLKQNCLTQTLKKQKRSEIIQKQFDIQQKRVQLAEQFKCKENSEFVNFEVDIRPILEDKWSQYKSQKEIVDYIVKGDQRNQVHDLISQNIIQDIQDYIRAYNQYIRNSYLNNILIIQQDCLEDFFGKNILNNIIVKYKQDIQTVMFKESGFISQEIFSYITDIMLEMKNLESVAFFASQPTKGCYSLLDKLMEMENFKYIVLNQTLFDIKNFGKRQMFEYKVSNPSTHFGFYILDCNKDLYYKDLYQFTPYSQEKIRDILNIEKLTLKEPKYEIEELLNQQSKYSIDMQNEIKKYKDETILHYRGVSWNIMNKYFGTLDNDADIQNQMELEEDIRELIKFENMCNSAMIDQLKNKLKNIAIKKKLEEKQIENYKVEEIYRIDKFDYNSLIYYKDSISIYYQFLRDQFALCQSKQIVIYDYFFSCVDEKIYSNFNKSFFKQFFEYWKRQKSEQKYKKSKVKGYSFIFNQNQILYKLIEFQQDSKNYYIKMDKEARQMKANQKKSISDFYTQKIEESFKNNVLDKLDQLKNNQLFNEIEYEVSVYNLIGNKYMQIFEEKDIKINKLIIKGESQLNIDFIPNFVKKLYLKNFTINQELFLKHNLETIVLEDCNIDFKSIQIQFQNLKKIKFLNSNEYVDDFIEFLIHQREQSQSTLNQITVQIKSSKYICLSNQTVQRMLNQNNINFIILDIDHQTKGYIIDYQNQKSFQQINKQSKAFQVFNEEIEGIQFNQQNNSYILEKKNISKLQQKTNSSINKDNQIYSYKNKLNSLRNLFLKDTHLDLFFKTRNYALDLNKEKCQDDIQKSLNQLSPCCKNILEKGNQLTSFRDQLYNHKKDDIQDRFCFFKSSLFISPLQPKKLQIRFFQYIFIGQNWLHSNKEVDFIEQLDFSESVFYDKQQFKFVDYLIQNSPQLEKVKFKNIKMSSRVFNEQLQPIKNRSLKKIDLSENQQNDILPVLKAMQELSVLEKIKFIKIDLFSDEIKQIIEKNQTSLKVLKINISLQSYLDQVIMNCISLEKLFISYNSIIDWNIIRMPSLKEVKIYCDNTISEKQLKCFESISNTCSHLQRIELYINYEYSFYMKSQIFIDRRSRSYLDIIPKKYHINDCDSFKIKNETQNKLMKNTQEAYYIEWDKSYTNHYFYRNSLFQESKNTLIILSLVNCDLDNFNIEQIDFENLPRTLKKLIIKGNEKLSIKIYLYSFEKYN